MDTKITAIVCLMTVSGALASDLFSIFWDKSGSPIGSVAFDVSNRGCFAVPGAAQVSFSQAYSWQNASGPYCLTSYHPNPDTPCSNFLANQEFSNVDPTDGHPYWDPIMEKLDKGVADAANYTWAPAACDYLPPAPKGQ